ncbi:TetR family transcriptional regulator [Longimycelium tulufanense]|uniref:TetR family transcriptional regulator n=1 Tax=Longimycelium tulufanense TaxID=907463 RepID=A0A8J3FUX2_9PSEU|nr:TetR/AcrR family transcriptional regulator [Longimycelium tulufanense]GGM53650.1 TetR family transcriptional regulator [Longimycelium tulufanense]
MTDVEETDAGPGTVVPLGRARRRRMAPAERRRDLIAAALELFSQRDPELVTVEDIAAHADVSRALFYRYFSNIREIRAAALRRAVDGLIARLIVPRTGPLLAQLRAALNEFLDFAESYEASYVTLLRSGSTVATAETSALVDEVRVRAVAEILDRLGVEELTPFVSLTLRCWVAVVEGTVLTWLQERTLPRDELVSWLIDQLLAMGAATVAHDPAAQALLDRVSTELSG